MFDFKLSSSKVTPTFLRLCGKGCDRGRIENAMPFGGRGQRGILVLFDQPNKVQWKARKWLADKSILIYQALFRAGVDLTKDIYVGSVFGCCGDEIKPPKYDCCMGHFTYEIGKIKPKLILTVGPIATGAVLYLYNHNHFVSGAPDARYYGECLPLNQNGWSCWLAPVQSEEEIKANGNDQVRRVAEDWVARNVQYAVDVGAVRPDPYVVPNVEVLLDAQQAVEAIEQASSSKYSAFDYETSRLEPQYPNSKILTASIAMGDSEKVDRIVAFSMMDKAVQKPWVDFLQSPTRKIGANIKFEHYWSKVFLNTEVQNWYWDVNITARVFNCMPGRSGLKRLAFSYFGVVGYDDTVEKYMKPEADGANTLEKLLGTGGGVSFNEVFIYNGLDSAFTYECAKKQHQMLGLPF